MRTPLVPGAPPDAGGCEYYRALFERSLDCVYIHDFAGHILDANPAILSLLGYSREDLPALTLDDVLEADQQPAIERALAELRETGAMKEVAEFRLRCKNGDFVEVETKTSVICRAGEPPAILGVARDITRRKRVEQELRNSEERFRQIAEIAGDTIWEVDADGLYLFSSPAVEKILGYQPHEADREGALLRSVRPGCEGGVESGRRGKVRRPRIVPGSPETTCSAWMAGLRFWRSVVYRCWTRPGT